jgi:hypothetical protein
MAQFTGPRSLYTQTADTYINANRQTRDVRGAINLLDAKNAALLTLLRRMRSQVTTNPKFEWQEDTFPTQSSTVSADDASSAATTVYITDYAYIRKGDLWMNVDNNEVIWVDTTPTSTAISCVRGVGGTSPADWDSGDEVFYIGNGQPTGARARDQITTIVTQPYNYTQIFEEPVEITGTAAATDLYGGPDRPYQRRKHGDLHMRDIERGLWWGERARMDGSDSANITYATYTTRGVFRWIDSTNEHTNTTTLTEDEFNGYLRTDFRYGNSVKFMFCSPLALEVISSWGRDKLQLVPRDKTYGLHITRYISPHGELNLLNNKLFQDFNVTDGTNYGASSVILDLEDLKYRFLKGRDTSLKIGIQENDEDTFEDMWFTDCGLHFEQPLHHAAIYDWSL